MASSTPRSSRVEIAAPAGSLEKLMFAVRYGAHSVYFGGDSFNLREGADNFSIDDIAAGAAFCAAHGAKSTFLLNAFLHEADVPAARDYLAAVRDIPFDAVMISDPGMLALVRESGLACPIHLSTQMSTLNHLAVSFWERAGISRIVLARETALEDIRMIRAHTAAEIEIFVHGALCIAYSGRCLLSRYLSGRDANQGACAHPCRWNYSLVEEKRPGAPMDMIEYDRGTTILSSKDLCLIERLPEYVAAGVNAFKIEGRMKSVYYTANTTRVYRHALDTIIDGGPYEERLPFWRRELDLVNHRPYTDDLFHEFDSLGFVDVPYVKKALFLGYVDGDVSGSAASVRVFNPIHRGESIEAIVPIRGHAVDDGRFVVDEILENGTIVDMARPGKPCTIRFDRPVKSDAIFRRLITT